MSRIRTPVYTTPELKEAWAKAAKDMGASESFIASQALKAYLSPTPIPTQEVKP